MTWARKLAVTAAATGVAVFGTGTQAYASTNVGWFYTLNYRDAVFFDADLNGYPGLEKITVCDNTTDGLGARAVIRNRNTLEDEVTVTDPSNNGQCASSEWNMWAEETPLNIWVFNYAGTHAYNLNISNDGVA